MKNSKGTIGNRTRDIPAYSPMPEPTEPPRSLQLMDVSKTTKETTTVEWRVEWRNVNNPGILCPFQTCHEENLCLVQPCFNRRHSDDILYSLLYSYESSQLYFIRKYAPWSRNKHTSRVLERKLKYVEGSRISHGTACLITLGTMRVYIATMDTAFALRKHTCVVHAKYKRELF